MSCRINYRSSLFSSSPVHATWGPQLVGKAVHVNNWKVWLRHSVQCRLLIKVRFKFSSSRTKSWVASCHSMYLPSSSWTVCCTAHRGYLAFAQICVGCRELSPTQTPILGNDLLKITWHLLLNIYICHCSHIYIILQWMCFRFLPTNQTQQPV